MKEAGSLLVEILENQKVDRVFYNEKNSKNLLIFLRVLYLH